MENFFFFLFLNENDTGIQTAAAQLAPISSTQETTV
jgi:hypothetical protein